MHIAEGFLPYPWWILWFVACLPAVAYGVHRIVNLTEALPMMRTTLALSGAFAFVLSALKIPSITGSTSHATGTGFGAILLGPAIVSVLGLIVLLFQALLLAHGGLTTLGANLFAMGIIGPVIAWLFYRVCARTGMSFYYSVLLAAFMGDIATYITTSLQLALAFPAASGGVIASFRAFLAIFAITQLPLALIEGILTAGICRYIHELRPDILQRLRVTVPENKGKRAEGGRTA
ncbi:MAG TPA: energy-coupling factor ABC transporter permease [Candidatus Methanoperedenaceae archaeon]|nr:energy-coupling factor ABC transporter permease [Candidatus Methanoperedenaceae archaeon]